MKIKLIGFKSMDKLYKS